MKIVCIGRNYIAHIQELANEVPSSPVIFFKSNDSLIQSATIPYPSFTNELHYECEVVLRLNCDIQIGEKIKDIRDYCDAWTVGIDFTARDIQQSLKSKGLPWELAKSFANATLIGEWQALPAEDLYNNSFSMNRNGIIVQDGTLSNMIYNFESILTYCATYFKFSAGDILFTGTPEGVGAVHSGDKYEGYLENVRLFTLNIE